MFSLYRAISYLMCLSMHSWQDIDSLTIVNAVALNGT